MPVIDIIILVAIVVSVVVGMVRWLDSEELQMWFGRIFLFAVILSVGGLLSWGLSKLVRLSILSGMDRFLGSLFGICRGLLLIAVAVILGEFAGFSNDPWWQDSMLIPHLEVVADWIKVMAPEGYELLTPDAPANALPVELPQQLWLPGGE